MKILRGIIDALRSALAKRAGLLRVLALLGSAVVMTAATPNAAEACGITDPVSCVALIFIKIFQLLTALMGWILVLEVDALIRVSQYHNFVSPGPSAVRIGWIVTRDLANMFFIVILLVIAFGTILGSSTYHYEKNLPRLLIMAVVINFSKTICGIFIDMGQVVMLTFVNGFKEAAGGNFVNAFQINKLLALGDSAGTYTFGMVVAMMFAFILSAVAVSVVLVMLVISIFRIVMLWVLIILSPIAFLTSAIPKGGEYYGQWWKEFKKYIITGPIIAFFLWLSLASVQDAGTTGMAAEGQGFPKSSAASVGEAGTASTVGDSKIPSEAGASSDVIMNMVIAICLMFAGLKFASESGVVGLGVAKTIRNTATKAARGVATYGAKRAAEPFLTRGGAMLAKVPLVGGLGRAAVLQGEKWQKKRVAGKEGVFGSSADLARLSPGRYASTSRIAGATKDEKFETMKVATQNSDAASRLKASGGAKQLLRDAEEIAKKDPSKKPELDAFKKTMWSEIEDPKERKAVMGRLTGEEARKYMKASDITDTNLDNLSKDTTLDILKNGKDDQKAAVMGAIGDKIALGGGEIDKFMKEKRMTWSDIPAEAYDHAALSGKGIKQSALAAAERDPNMLKRFADDPKMRDVLADEAEERLKTAVEGPDRAMKRATAMMLGSKEAGTFKTVEDEKEFAQLSLKQLNELDRNSPVDSKEIQDAIDRGMTAAMKHGSTEIAQAIRNSPTMSQRVPLSEARVAEQSTNKFTSSVNNAATNKIADLDRQRKMPGAATAAIDAQLANLRKAVSDVKDATKNLAAAEEAVMTQKENYLAAQKANNAALMKTVAAAIKSAINDVETKKAAVASANSALKAQT